jgi:hypothetical protein
MTTPASKPKRRRRIGTWLAILLVGVPIGLFFNLVTVSALVSGVVIGYQHARGTVVTGVITDAASHTVPSRRGPDETYCYGLFRADDDRLSTVRVRVYVEGYCFDARGRSATLVYGAAAGLTDRMGEGDRVGGPMPFNGLFGMTRGAVLDRGPFVRGLWPFLFLAPVAAIIDVAMVSGIRGRFRSRTVTRPDRGRRAR